ncbi:MAG: NPCBM/NEW2 domain-containing protein [Planctomycetota bacterium]
MMLSLMASLMAIAPAAGSVGAAVRTTTGETVSGLVAGFSASEGLKLVLDGGATRALPASSILQVRFQSDLKLADIPAQVAVALLNGDRLLGTIAGGDGEQLKLETAALGRLSIDIEHIRGMTFAADAKTAPPDLKSFLPDKNVTDDLLYRRISQGTDSISGTLERLGTEDLQFACALGKVKFPFTSTVALVIAPQYDPPEVKPPKVFLALRDGGSLSGHLVELGEGALVLDCLLGKQYQIELTRLDALRFTGGGFEYLSDREPVRVEEVPYVGDAQDFRFPYRRDASVTGRPLFAGGTRYTKGLGVHSRCALTYDVSAGYERFEASYALADEVKELPGKSSVIFRVSVDGEMRFESPVVGKDDPVRAIPPVLLKGARALRLEVDFADNYDIADRALWLEPVLIR